MEVRIMSLIMENPSSLHGSGFIPFTNTAAPVNVKTNAYPTDEDMRNFRCRTYH